MKLTEDQIRALVAYGVAKVPLVNDVFTEVDTFKDFSDKQLTVIITCYASALAKLTRLSMTEFLQLVVCAYQNVDISKKEEPKADA